MSEQKMKRNSTVIVNAKTININYTPLANVKSNEKWITMLDPAIKRCASVTVNANTINCNYNPHTKLKVIKDQNSKPSVTVKNRTDENSQNTSNNIPVIGTTNDNNNTNNNIPVIDLIEDGDQNTTCHTPVIDLTNDNDQNSSNNIPDIDLTNDHDQNSSNNIPVIDLTNDNDEYTNSNTPENDLTNDTDDDQNSSSRIPVIVFTNNNNQNSSKNIPVIDLTTDDGEYTYRNTPVIDLTNDNDDEQNTRSIEVIDLIYDDDQNTYYNIPVIDLTNDDDDDQNSNRYFPVIDLTNNDDQTTNHDIPPTNSTGCDGQDIHPSIDVGDGYNEDTSQRIAVINWTDNEKLDIYNGAQLIQQNTASSLKKTACNTIGDYNGHIIDHSINPKGSYSNKSSKYEDTKTRRRYNIERSGEVSQSKECPGSDRKVLRDPEQLSHPVPLKHSIARSVASTSKKVVIEQSMNGEFNIHTTASALLRQRGKTDHNSDASNSVQTDSKVKSSIIQKLKPSRTKQDVDFESLKTAFLSLWIFVVTWILKLTRQIVNQE